MASSVERKWREPGRTVSVPGWDAAGVGEENRERRRTPGISIVILLGLLALASFF
jgi:hypothetical protein